MQCIVGLNLHCPFFLQDKFEYLRMVREITLQTLKIPFTFASVEEKLQSTLLIHDFLHNGYHEDSGWVLKVPHTTNSFGVRFSKTKERLFSWIDILESIYFILF